MRLSTIDILLVIVSVISIFICLIQGFILYKISKSVNAKGETLVDPITSDDILTGASLFDKIKIKYYEEPQKFLKVYFFIMFITPVLAIPGINTLYTKYLEEPYVKIISPADNQTVDSVFSAAGDFKNVKQFEETIWAAVYSVSENKYYLHRKSVELNYETWKWKCDNIYIPTRHNNGEKLRLEIFLVDKKTKTYDDIIDNISKDEGRPVETLPVDCRVMGNKEIIVK